MPTARTVRSHRCRQSGPRGPGASGRRGTGVLRPACTDYASKRPCQLHLIYTVRQVSRRHLNALLGRQRSRHSHSKFEAGAMNRIVSGVTPGVKSIVYDACAEVMRSQSTARTPRCTRPGGATTRRAAELLPQSPADGSVAAAWSMGSPRSRRAADRRAHASPAPSAW